tara:strand:- start:52559 stop:52747 length:189 start_codon:yes stop_codon:yes gene_type:complete
MITPFAALISPIADRMIVVREFLNTKFRDIYQHPAALAKFYRQAQLIELWCEQFKWGAVTLL